MTQASLSNFPMCQTTHGKYPVEKIPKNQIIPMALPMVKLDILSSNIFQVFRDHSTSCQALLGAF